MHRHCTPAKELQSLFCGNDFHHPHGKRTLHCILRQKEHANAVIPLFLQRNAGFSRRLFEEGMGHLGEDADPVPYFTGCVFACSVLQLFYNMQRIIQRTIVLMAVNIDNCTDAAAVLFF